MEEKPVKEVTAATNRVDKVLGLNEKYFPHQENTQQCNLKKMHGMFKIVTSQQLWHGNDQGWDSSHPK